jgi:hypothetical protein
MRASTVTVVSVESGPLDTGQDVCRVAPVQSGDRSKAFNDCGVECDDQ